MKMITCHSLGGANCRWVGEAEDIDALADRVRHHAKEMHRREWEHKMGRISDEEMKDMIMKYAKDKWQGTKEDTRDVWEDTKEGAKESWDDTKGKTKEAWHDTKDAARDMKEGVKEKTHKAKKKLS